MRTNNQEALFDAVLAGTGLAMLPTWLIRDPPQDGRLQRVLTEFEGLRTPVYAVFPRHGVQPNKVRALVEFLADRYHERDALSGLPSLATTIDMSFIAHRRGNPRSVSARTGATTRSLLGDTSNPSREYHGAFQERL